MTGSMYAAISGLKSHMNALSVIGNNISNVNTLGYKTTRYTFNEALYTTQRSGSDGTASLGGVNPAQIGFGASLGTIDLDMSTKNYTLTGRNLDTMIDGDGFFLVGDKVVGDIINDKTGIDFDGDPGEIAYLKTLNLTRLGNFNIDANGYLVDGNGNVAWGFLETTANNTKAKDANGDEIDTTILEQIEIVNKGTFAQAKKDDKTTYNTLTDQQKKDLDDLIKAAEEINTSSWHNVSKRPDGIITSVTSTNSETLTAIRLPTLLTLTDAKGNSSTALSWPSDGTARVDDADDNKKNNALVYYGETVIDLSRADDNGIVYSAYNAGGTAATGATAYVLQNGALYYGTANTDTSEGAPAYVADTNRLIYNISYTRLQPDSVSINDKTGALTVLTSDQQLLTIGYLAIAKVTNPNGVTHVDGRYYQAKDGAGELRVTTIGGAVEGVESAGDTALITGGLESSGTDLATEITNMITVQRGYQANTRIVTVTDSMLEELVNMKR